MLSFTKGVATAALVLTLPLMGVSAGHAAPLAPSIGTTLGNGVASAHEITDVQYRRHWGGPGYGYRGGYYRHGGGGWGWGGAAAGLAAGALIGGAIAASQQPRYYAPAPGYYGGGDPNAVAYCSQRYRSYDPASGTYLNYDGNRYPCP